MLALPSSSRQDERSYRRKLMSYDENDEAKIDSLEPKKQSSGSFGVMQETAKTKT